LLPDRPRDGDDGGEGATLPPCFRLTAGNPYLVGFDDLAAFVGTRKVNAIKAWLARNRIQYMTDHKHRPITTVSAINRGLTDRREGAGRLTDGVYLGPPRKLSPADALFLASLKEAGRKGR
jgi:hypothetical protein